MVLPDPDAAIVDAHERIDALEGRCAAPSVDERIDRLRADVNALYRLIPDELEARAERERKDRWHATYNAAMPLWSQMLDPADRHRACVEAADVAHGPLVKPGGG